jgi:hypothetical protein
VLNTILSGKRFLKIPLQDGSDIGFKCTEDGRDSEVTNCSVSSISSEADDSE